MLLRLERMIGAQIQSGEISLESYLNLNESNPELFKKYWHELSDAEKLDYKNIFTKSPKKVTGGYDMPIEDTPVKNPENIGEWIDDK